MTFRLGDALPAAVVARLRTQVEVEGLNRSDVRHGPALRKRIHAWMDAGHGCCLLGSAAENDMVRQALLHDDGCSCRMDAFVIMPNHVHVLVQVGDVPMGELVRRWKGRSARAINAATGRRGPLWCREYYDRFIRDENHFRIALRYLVKNPVRAGLVACAQEWRGFYLRHDLRSLLRSVCEGELSDSNLCPDSPIG